jgi:hypothetical protein
MGVRGRWGTNTEMTSTLAYSSLEGKTSIRSSNLAKAINDLRDGLNAWELWGTLGWHGLRQRYRRSTFGPLWLTLSMGIMAGAIGVLYAEIFGQPIHDYLPFLAVGLIVWGFISTSIIDPCYVFILSEGVIRQVRAPLSIHIYRVVWRNLIVLAHNMVIYVIILVVFGIWPGAPILLFIPSLLLLSIKRGLDGTVDRFAQRTVPRSAAHHRKYHADLVFAHSNIVENRPAEWQSQTFGPTQSALSYRRSDAHAAFGASAPCVQLDFRHRRCGAQLCRNVLVLCSLSRAHRLLGLSG